MKKIFSILLVCCTAFAYAKDEPVFEEADENEQVGAFARFAAQEEPIFEEDNESSTCNDNGCEDGGCKILPAPALRGYTYPDQQTCYSSWTRYKANFGIEKLFIRFPQRPAISQSNTLLTAYAYDNAVLYSLTGYYPPIGSLNPVIWFDEALYSISHYPYTLVSHVIFQTSSGDWVMDYVAHDYIQNSILKARAIVTPFNAYTLQCVKPNGSRDYFDYFLDNFWIKCECY